MARTRIRRVKGGWKPLHLYFLYQPKHGTGLSKDYRPKRLIHAKQSVQPIGSAIASFGCQLARSQTFLKLCSIRCCPHHSVIRQQTRVRSFGTPSTRAALKDGTRLFCNENKRIWKYTSYTSRKVCSALMLPWVSNLVRRIQLNIYICLLAI